jgi:hypothetical protein
MRCDILDGAVHSTTIRGLLARPGREQGERAMRIGIILAAALTIISATAAHAEEWCGYAAHANSIVECGYSSIEGCENSIGRGGMCFINPYLVLNSKRAAPATPVKLPVRHG